MKLRLDGLWSRSPNLLLELRDLRSVAGACREGGAESIAAESATFFWLNIVVSFGCRFWDNATFMSKI